MKFRLVITLAVLVLLVVNPVTLKATGTSSNFQLVGQNPLFNRGMNAALAIFQDFLYVGNRTDGSSRCGFGDPRRTDPNFGLDSCPHVHPGILILSIEDPTKPTFVGEIPAPLNAATPPAPVGVTSRELRVWPNKKLLITMNFRCSSLIHACPRTTDTQSPFDLKFFNLKDPVHPQFISHFVPTSKAGVQVKPHEMFLWVDPNNDDRALLFLSTPAISTDPTRPNLMIVDISQVPAGGAVTEVAEGNWNNRYPGADNPANYGFNLFVHSMGVTADGTRTYLAMEAGEFLVLDTSDIANNVSNPQL